MVKKILILVLAIAFKINAQVNLVPNPSFEDTINCPEALAQVYNCKFWDSFKESSDYFNSCYSSTISGVSTPYNLFGYQTPHSGNAYIGTIVYPSPTQYASNYREYFGAKLTSTLILNQKYFFSMRCVAAKSNWASFNCYSSKLGVNFSKTLYSVSNPYPITNSAKIYANTVISDTANWQLIKGSFISDSLYRYIIIGNFFNNNVTDTMIFNGNPNCTSYYFIDDVCLSTDSLFAFNYDYVGVKSLMNKALEFNIYPNPATNVLNLESNLLNENYSISDVFGRILIEGFYSKNKIKISISSLQNGVYFLIIRNQKRKFLVCNN